MDKKDYLAHQFATLRREIEGYQNRVFWIVLIGLVGIPALSYFMLSATVPIWMTLPFVLLVLIVLFLAQQNHMMRAGRYIREHIESQIDYAPGWEAWIESRPEFRMMDKHFVASLLILFFLFYFLLIGLALHRLAAQALEGPAGGTGWWFLGGAAVVYGIATLFGLFTLFHHWRMAVSTIPEP